MMNPINNLIVAALAILAPGLPFERSHATDKPVPLSLEDPVPKNMLAARPNGSSFVGSHNSVRGEQPPPTIGEEDFKSPKRRQPDRERTPSIVTTFKDKRVQISGYVVPLMFEARRVTKFLLVSYVGA